jgi:hypothetical protein
MSTSIHDIVSNGSLLSTPNRFGSLYDALPENDKDEIMHLAKQKLLGGQIEPTDAGTLACLSVRFALEFNFAIGDARRVARDQIDHHMRLCVAATTGLKTLVTVAGSEPFLAEAAYQLQDLSKTNPVRDLASHRDLNYVDHGLRGELVAAFLIMQARDASLIKQVASPKRSITVTDFMKAFLPAPAYEKLENVWPTHWCPAENKQFKDAFRGYRMWFNHVIRIRNYDLINIKSLWKFITRGAMVMCADNQRGVDIILPICDPDRNLSRDNVTAILIQVKDDKFFQHRIDKTLFDAMDPYRVGLFNGEDSPLPVVRMVLALASDQAGVFFPPVVEDVHHCGRFTAYDVWCAGLSGDTFKDVDDDIDSYRTLLERSLQPNGAYHLEETTDLYLDQDTREAKGLRRRRLESLAFSEDGGQDNDSTKSRPRKRSKKMKKKRRVG